ncbi:Arylsulfatase [Maioricimonas rarisocia]|uniref:Arylsulfatase n=1 Tax=Maioricimonas rarisocia TaxID=2528026 RepID=A0A517Z5J7_9PLAN|nr:sulfatase-like hydrolase/transferase [Maioricimonas rarisocia]QDU37735.1 Arylsulfatase [Maioricimonas rarisocia]
MSLGTLFSSVQQHGRTLLQGVGRTIAALLVTLSLVGVIRADEASSHPNVVLIMTDDQGWGDIASHGNRWISTPNMDRIASEGARFERFYVSPVCAPTRASLMTGRYSLRTGVHGVTGGAENMRPNEVTLAEIFQSAGYATGCFGKWHNGRHYPMHPNGQGFDEFVGFCAGHWNNYFDARLEHNGDWFESDGYITDVITDHALSFIDENQSKPFFTYLPYNAPHTPWQVPDSYWEKYDDPELDPAARCAYAMCESIDDNIGRILKKLDDLALSEQTVVLFLTDNGPNSNRYNGGMRGRKGSVHEGGVRVPLFVRWPGHIEAGTVVEPITMHIDLLPTLVDLCGVPMPETHPLDGRSLAPLLMDAPGVDWPDRILLTFRTRGGQPEFLRGAARDQRYRAVLENAKQGWQLYDMQADPGQKQNIASDHPDIVASLRSEFEGAVAAIQPEQLTPLPIPVGHGRRVEIPGHEALFHPAEGEGISYYGEHGYANDWIDNWTDIQAWPYWRIDVHQAGRYEVTLQYAATPDAVGTKLRVEAGDHSVTGTITEPHAGPFLPVYNRFGTKEAPFRVWKPLTLGTIKLPAGQTQLRIRAVEKPGDEVAEIKEVHLTPVK